MTEDDIKNAQVNYRYYTWMFVVFGFLMFAYSFYLVFRYGTFLGWLLGMAVSTLFFSQAFNYDFWVFQIKRRKLGATFAEWKRDFLGEKEAPPK